MNDSRPRRLSEFALIAQVFAPLAAKVPGAYGLADDAGSLRLGPDKELIVTVDTVIEGVHFLQADPPEAIAKKALRVNLSDLAAKGAEPQTYLLALSVPAWPDDRWLARFAEGLGADQQRYGIGLLGGDTASTPGPLTISITALGAVPLGHMLRRSGARPGDRVFVSGTIGDAGAGLAVLKGEGGWLSPSDQEALIARYRLPEPRVVLGPRLLGLASAALDVSDGLIADLGHIAEVSGVGITIESARVPLSPALVSLWGRGPLAIARAATSGDDYEIAFTAPESARAAIAAAAEAAGVAVHEIGHVREGQGVVLLDEAGQAIPTGQPGYTHF